MMLNGLLLLTQFFLVLVGFQLNMTLQLMQFALFWLMKTTTLTTLTGEISLPALKSLLVSIFNKFLNVALLTVMLTLSTL